MKKIPWLSLTILLVAYMTVGWVLSASPWYIFLLAIALILLLAEILAAPFSNVRKALVYSFSTDTRGFILIISIAFFATVLAIWIHIVAHTLVLLAAGLLARLDMLTARFTDWQAFWVLSFVSLAGFGLGWAAHYLSAIGL
ncbi:MULTISPECIES: hypothetical protein [Aerosakkonema]|uniref:hypothetical protein n=1 Tax=Aerosakkonema TaxID=1246629 RepID=UPI0035B76CD9